MERVRQQTNDTGPLGEIEALKEAWRRQVIGRFPLTDVRHGRF
jgi:hypothetical protein